MNIDLTTSSTLQFDQSKLKQLLEKQINFSKKYVKIFNYTEKEFEKYIKDKKNYMGKFWEYNSNETKLVKIQLKTIQRKLEKIKEETK
jgi:hypothetical protein